MFLFRGYCQIILLVSTLSANQCLMESRVIKYDSLFNKFYRVCSNRFNTHQNLIELLNFGTDHVLSNIGIKTMQKKHSFKTNSTSLTNSQTLKGTRITIHQTRQL